MIEENKAVVFEEASDRIKAEFGMDTGSDEGDFAACSIRNEKLELIYESIRTRFESMVAEEQRKEIVERLISVGVLRPKESILDFMIAYPPKGYENGEVFPGYADFIINTGRENTGKTLWNPSEMSERFYRCHDRIIQLEDTKERLRRDVPYPKVSFDMETPGICHGKSVFGHDIILANYPGTSIVGNSGLVMYGAGTVDSVEYQRGIEITIDNGIWDFKRIAPSFIEDYGPKPFVEKPYKDKSIRIPKHEYQVYVNKKPKKKRRK